jgi:hypothetical protein
MSSAMLGGGSMFSSPNSRVGGDMAKPCSSMGGEAPAGTAQPSLLTLRPSTVCCTVLDTCLNSVNRRLLAAAQHHRATREHGQLVQGETMG